MEKNTMSLNTIPSNNNISLKISPKNSYKKKFNVFAEENQEPEKVKTPRNNKSRIFEGFNERTIEKLD